MTILGMRIRISQACYEFMIIANRAEIFIVDPAELRNKIQFIEAAQPCILYKNSFKTSSDFFKATMYENTLHTLKSNNTVAFIKNFRQMKKKTVFHLLRRID